MRVSRSLVVVWWIFLLFVLVGCGAELPARPEAGRHVPAPPVVTAAIPAVVATPPVVLPPLPEPEMEVYTVVVHEVPVRELLFAMARDAALNIDIHPGISGNVTLNAVDQTLPQILARLARQVDLRWEFKPPNLVITPDIPYLHTYRIDYVNISRKSIGKVSVSTSIATTGATPVGGGGGGGGSNDSTTSLEQMSNNLFWETLLANLKAILGESADGTPAAPTPPPAPASVAAPATPAGAAGAAVAPVAAPASVVAAPTIQASAIISNPESGLIMVRATGKQHAEIARFIDQMLGRALKQVLIEATVVEVRLNDQYQAGVDWSAVSLKGKTTLNLAQTLLTGLSPTVAPGVTSLVLDRNSTRSDINVTVRMLEQFGDTKVLSTPRVMALNNQTAILKVVDNKVYFTIKVDITPATVAGALPTIAYTSEVHTVPVGFVMAVTPQIGDQDAITLNVRPTISRILGYVNDPNPALAEADVVSKIPEIQVREIESILKVNSGQVAVLGGLMQDSIVNSNAGLPGISRLPGIGSLFSYKDDTATKTELVIFIRPMVIRQASLDGDLGQYREFLPDRVQPSLFKQSNNPYGGAQ